ncbi:hypothetical protein GCM10022255_098200 [Dactylosporangium darangshiense]|uniref:Uncharacterized protein n=1 Tax=Dactylosporangium darangshiense TaxID=579108 RepID=A0ABP8DR70_9ACTN
MPPTISLPSAGPYVRIASLYRVRLWPRWLLPRRYLVGARIPTPYAGVSFSRAPDGASQAR